MKRQWMCLVLSLLALAPYVQAQDWLPESDESLEVVSHFAINIGYHDYHEVPQWVAYILRREHLQNCFDRTDNFREDRAISTGSALPTDYKSSGYDRGHIAPAGDMKWSSRAMQDSFLMSNITPQSGTMNRGRWATLETLVRAWAKEGDETIIVSGPILKDGLPRIGATGVSVPEDHYKVLLRTKNGKQSAIGFLMGKNPAARDLESYVLSVRQIEELAGINFFPQLGNRDDIETKVEFKDWDFKAKFSYDRCSN